MQIIDLTMPINKGMPVFSGSRTPGLQQIASIEKDGWNEHHLSVSTHVGTHIDAPWHFVKDGKKLDKVDLERLVGDGLVIDCRKYKEISKDAVKSNVRNKIVFFYTGQSKKTKEEYGKNAPVVSDELAKLLVKGKVKCIGVDSFSPDGEPYNVHRILLSKDIPIVENLVNLDKLLNKKFQAIILPLKVDLDGAPCRVIGII